MQEIVIDVNTRKLLMPSNLNALGVAGDKNVNRLYFRGPRYYCDCDLSTYKTCILFKNNNTERDPYEVSDFAVDGEEITFSWLVGEEAVAEAGETAFSVCMSATDSEGKETNDFNTTTARLLVLEGLPDE